MRYIGITILLVLCLTLLLTGCIVDIVIAKTAIGNVENQEDTEEPVIENTEGSVKWSGLGMDLYNTGTTAEFDDDVDTLLANGFTQLRMSSDWFDWDEDTELLSDILSAIAKGAQVIWVVQSGAVTLTSSNWDNYTDAVLAAAQWAQANGVYEFLLGNEEEQHVDGTTMTVAQLIINLKSVATEVQEIFTNGNVSYSCLDDYIPDWITAGKGDIDILASNLYRGYLTFNDNWKTRITNLINAFGADGTYLTEFSLSSAGLDYYSEDEAVQAAGIAEMIDYIKASGMTRAFFYCYKDPWWLPGFGARKDDDTYRLLWNQALLNTGPVKFATIPTKTTTISLPDTIALIP